MKLPHKPFLENMTREHLLVLIKWMDVYRNAHPSDSDIAFCIWDHESRKNQKRGELLAEEGAAISYAANPRAWLAKHDEFSQNMKEFDQLQEFYNQYLGEARVKTK